MNAFNYFVKKYYREGRYTDEDLGLFVRVGYISEEEKLELIEWRKNNGTENDE